MNSTTEAILNKAREIAVIKNDARSMHQNQGVLFGSYRDHEGNEFDEAWVLSQNGIIRWSGVHLDYPKDRPFFNYREDFFTENLTTHRDIESVRRLYDDISVTMKESFLLPVANIISMFSEEFIEPENQFYRLNKTRVIIKNNNGFVFEKELILIFEDGHFFHPDPEIDYEFRVHPSSNLKEFVEGKFYRTMIVEDIEESGVAFIDVRDEYFKGIEIGIYETKKGAYMPESDREVTDFSEYPPNLVYRCPYLKDVPERGYEFEPIHIDGPMFFYMLRVFEGYEFMDVHLRSNKKTIIFAGVDPEIDDIPFIEALVGPFDPEIRGYYR